MDYGILNENPRKPQIWFVLLRQNEENQQTVTKIESLFKVVRILYQAKFQAIPLMGSIKMFWNCKLDLFYWSNCHQNDENQQNATEM